MNKLWIVLLAAFFLLVHIPVLPQDSADKVSFIPHWLPQAQFAGYYAAYELGIYKKYNIDLTILTGGPQHPSSEALKKGEADFSSLWLANAIQLRDEGHKIINIGQILRKSALMLIAKKSSGIRKPEDLNGKKVGLWNEFKLLPEQFFNKYNIKVNPVELGGTINLFLFDGIDVTSAMWYNEYHKIINSGYNEDELVTFFIADYGLNFPEEGIYVREELFNKNPDLCRRFMQATIEGWMWCFSNEKKAVEIVMKYMKAVNLGVNNSNQNWMLKTFRQMMFDGNSVNTELPEEDFEFVVRTLKENGIIKGSVKYKEFYKNPEGRK
jgi:NitT/TauT family transport system substrate-binding protein